MKLDQYIEAFRKLRVNRQKDHASPHKVCMLLAVIDLIENGRIESNDIFFNAELKQKYGHYFDVMRTHGDQQNPFLPYFHLRSEGFWSHVSESSAKRSCEST